MPHTKVRTRFVALTGAAALVAVALSSPASATLGSSWHALPQIPIPAGGMSAETWGVAPLSATDVWTVGEWSDTGPHPLVAHWDGAAWTVPTLAGGAGTLDAVDATAPDDVWAAGTGGGAPVVLHYDGGQWTPVPTPVPVGEIDGIDMLSTVDGWAVGSTTSGDQATQPLILHWRDGQWAATPVPLSGSLLSVSARAADDVWAVGTQDRVGGEPGNLVLHWDGASWQAVTVPGDQKEDTLTSVAALASGEVWAVGQACTTVGGAESCTPRAVRRSGGGWESMGVPTGGSELSSVVARSSADVWALGYQSVNRLQDSDFGLHWNGVRFGVDGPPAGNDHGDPASAILGAAATPGTGQLWAVGWSGAPASSKTHVLWRN